MQSKKTMLLGVGGSPEPILYSIKKHQPQKIIFFASERSAKSTLPQIYQQLSIFEYNFDLAIIITPDEQSLGQCLNSLLKNIPKAMIELDIPNKTWPDIIDYTGGTKAMSSAIVWASSKFKCLFSYIGTGKGEEGRDKNGLGIVINGREHCFIIENPWNNIAYYEIHTAMSLFNGARFFDATEMLNLASARITDNSIHNFILNLTKLVHGFYLWDTFQYREALSSIKKGLNEFKLSSEKEFYLLPGFKQFLIKVEESYDYLSYIPDGRLSINLIWDIVANSRRRGSSEGKFADAIIRLESAVEKLVNMELLTKFGIDTGNIELETLPDSFRSEYSGKYPKLKNDRNNIHLGIVAGYYLLKSKKNPIGIKFFEQEFLLKYYLHKYENIFANGLEIPTKNDYINLFESVCTLLGLKLEMMPVFPKIKYQY